MLMDLVLEPLAPSIYSVEIVVGEPLPLSLIFCLTCCQFFSIRSQSIAPSCTCQEGLLEWELARSSMASIGKNGSFLRAKIRRRYRSTTHYQTADDNRKFVSFWHLADI